MKITHLRSVTISAVDPPDLARFYEAEWGLSLQAADRGTCYLRGTAEEYRIVVIRPGERAGLIGYDLGLEHRLEVDAAADELERYPGVHIVEPPADLDEPGGGYGLSIADVDGRIVRLVADVAPAVPARHDPPVAPSRLSHLVINSPLPDDYSRFLVDVLGFAVADEMPHMIFFRCNSDHHSIAVARAPHASLNHIAFEVPSVDDVRKGVDRLASTAPMIWGPNRHGPGNNVFAYFEAPNGQVIEYTAEVQQIDENAPPAPRLWLPEESRLQDDWAEAATLRPTPEARESMLGYREPALVAASTVDPPGDFDGPTTGGEN